MLKFLKSAGIDGIFINSFAILEAIKVFKLPFKVIVDSYFDIHNLSGIDFVNSFHKVDEIIITEEIYLKNIVKLKNIQNFRLQLTPIIFPGAQKILKIPAQSTKL